MGFSGKEEFGCERTRRDTGHTRSSLAVYMAALLLHLPVVRKKSSRTCVIGVGASHASCLKWVTEGEDVGFLPISRLVSLSARHRCAAHSSDEGGNMAPSLSWQVAEWGPCDAACGEPGTRTRKVWCGFDPETAKQHAADLAFDDQGRATLAQNCSLDSVPRSTTACVGDCVALDNSSGSSARVDSGAKPAPVPVSDDAATVPSGAAQQDDDHPPSSAGPLLWKVGEWSACSKSCGAGIATREVHCVDGQGRQLEDEKCFPGAGFRPYDTISCNTQVCVLATRGRHMLQRSGYAAPMSKPGSCEVWVRVKPSRLVLRGQPPLFLRMHIIGQSATLTRQHPTFLQLCGNWVPQPWGPCETPCGAGVRTRAVFCLSAGGGVLSDASCAAEERPPLTIPCTGTNCGACQCGEWTAWSACRYGVRAPFNLRR